MKTKRARYQQGSIRQVRRAGGFVREARFSGVVNGKRTYKSTYFSGVDYPTEKSVPTALELTVPRVKSKSGREKVDAKCTTITALDRRDHLPRTRTDWRRLNRSPEIRRPPACHRPPKHSNTRDYAGNVVIGRYTAKERKCEPPTFRSYWKCDSKATDFHAGILRVRASEILAEKPFESITPISGIAGFDSEQKLSGSQLIAKVQCGAGIGVAD